MRKFKRKGVGQRLTLDRLLVNDTTLICKHTTTKQGGKVCLARLACTWGEKAAPSGEALALHTCIRCFCNLWDPWEPLVI